MDTFSVFLIFLAAVCFFNLLLLVVSLALFFRAKKAIEFSRTVYELEAASKKEVEQHLEATGAKLLEDMLTGFRQSFLDVSGQFSKTIEVAAEDQISAFGEFIRQQEALIVKQSQFVVERIIDEARVEISAYKEFAMRRVDEEVPKILERVSKEVLNKSISASEHQDLVMKALEAAKAEGIFNQGPIGKEVPKVQRVRVAPKVRRGLRT